MSTQPQTQTRAIAQSPFASVPVGLLQRKCACGQHTVGGGECEECRKKREGTLQRAAISTGPTNGVPSIVHDVLSSPGQPLDAGTRAFMEPRFGFDFSRVRVHTDARAAESAQAVNALAYTVGHNVVFGTGQYAPGTNEGRGLLAHELTHVVQQNQALIPERSQLVVGQENDLREGEAEKISQDIHVRPASRHDLASGEHITTSSTSTIQRQSPGTSSSTGGPAEEPNLLSQMFMRVFHLALPGLFPQRGIRIVGTDAANLVKILSDCTGIPLMIDSNQMLVELQGPVDESKGSATARKEVLRFLHNVPVGIIVDTNPSAAAVEEGAFSHKNPGYQQIDVANVLVLASASGARKGLSACDVVMHEIAEAFAGRQASLAGKGGDLFPPSHKEGSRVETLIRKDLGLPARSASEGDFQVLGNETKDTLIVLNSIVFGSGKEQFTQLNVIRFTINPAIVTEEGGLSGDSNVVASHVVRGIVRFKNQEEALKTFNRFASVFGFAPIKIPAKKSAVK